MNRLVKFFLCALILCITEQHLVSQEKLGSEIERYYDFLSLDGYSDRPYLNYRSLSDSVWKTLYPEQALWSSQFLPRDHGLGERSSWRVYGPEVFFSYNSKAPLGQNDSLLWQGRGLNAYVTSGIRFSSYGFDATLKPEFSFSQNLAFDTVPSAYTSEAYAGRADRYGYYGVYSIDAPQRFGDDSLCDWSWGDSELRYTWRRLTLGFGTQHIWLGPARNNPLLLSNNAPPYPKIDFGLKPTEILPYGYNFGIIEVRAFWGKLDESSYFDLDEGNDSNLLTGFTLSYSPPFLRKLTIGFHRVMLSKWEDRDANTIFTLAWPLMDTDAGFDERDQRASVTLDYVLESAGFEMYLEWAKNDYSSNIESLLRYPFHAHAFTIGARKSFSLGSASLRGELAVEVTSIEMSQDFQFSWPSTFYAHHIITQGHTNGGQWLGAGIGTGGNSQYLACTIYHPKGLYRFFVQRVNPDNDYLYARSVYSTPSLGETGRASPEWYQFKTSVLFGLGTMYHFNKGLSLSGSLAYNLIINPVYENGATNDGPKWHNFQASCGLSYVF